jgi:hypothetical protein
VSTPKIAEKRPFLKEMPSSRALARALHSHTIGATLAPNHATSQRTKTMNAATTETRLNQFVARLLQSATSDVHTVRQPDAHTLALAFQAAFQSSKRAS